MVARTFRVAGPRGWGVVLILISSSRGSPASLLPAWVIAAAIAWLTVVKGCTVGLTLALARSVLVLVVLVDAVRIVPKPDRGPAPVDLRLEHDRVADRWALGPADKPGDSVARPPPAGRRAGSAKRIRPSLVSYFFLPPLPFFLCFAAFFFFFAAFAALQPVTAIFVDCLRTAPF